MTILCLGSVNIDHVYRVDRLPSPGETMADTGYATYLGGKGANMSLAASHAEGTVAHAGAIGLDGKWCRQQMAQAGINVDELVTVDEATGHAVIMVDAQAENMIVIHPGANQAIPRDTLLLALGRRVSTDWLLLQNETNLGPDAAHAAKVKGMKVAYAAAPFDATHTAEILPHADLLVMNTLEARQLATHLGVLAEDIPSPALLITDGAHGARYRGPEGTFQVPAFPVDAVDTTGAGDTFTGVFLAALDMGSGIQPALTRAAAAAAIQVTRPGAADAIPGSDEIDNFLKGRL